MSDIKHVSFDRAAEYYDETRGFPNGIAPSIGQLFAQTGSLTSQSRILDVGVGTGRIALPLAEHVGSVVGVDISLNMLDVLRRHQTTQPIQVIAASGADLPLPNASFDAVVAVHIFHLIPQWGRTLSEMRRVLRPGALLLHGYNGNDTLADIRRDAFGDSNELAVGIPWGQLEETLSTRGWQKVTAQQFSYEYERVPAILVEQLRRRIWSRTWFMSDEDLATVSQRMEDLLRTRYGDAQQPITLQNTFTVEAYSVS